MSTTKFITTIISKIEQYYPAIDRVDIPKVMQLFASDSTYKRADKEYVGQEAIAQFFTHERRIRGHHDFRIIATAPEARTVVVTGKFRGRGAKGDPRAVAFADIWEV